MARLAASIFLSCLLPLSALAYEPPLADAAKEAQAKTLFRELRCMVCAGESIAESHAEVATDLRREVRQRLIAGEPPDAVKAYLVSRYGESILMAPPFTVHSSLLWLMPLLALITGATIIIIYFRRAYSKRAGSAG